MISCLHGRQPEQSCVLVTAQGIVLILWSLLRLQGATSGAAALKVGVGRGPAVTV